LEKGEINMNRRWINFARYSSPPIGKGKILDCGFTEHDRRMPSFYLKIEIEGVVYEGTLPVNGLMKVSEEEE
jgi:hypothetical protein